MTELKTLKDCEDVSLDCEDKGHRYISERELKAKAVKWVKEIRKDRTIGVQLFTDRKKRKGNPIGKAIYGDEERKIINREKEELLIDFFNLTSKDIKDIEMVARRI